MYYVYILKSQKYSRRYVGSTENVEVRLGQHNLGKVRSTKGYKPYRLLYVEQYATRTEARKRENFLKSGVGLEWIDAVIANSAEGCPSG